MTIQQAAEGKYPYWKHDDWDDPKGVARDKMVVDLQRAAFLAGANWQQGENQFWNLLEELGVEYHSRLEKLSKKYFVKKV